MSCGNKIKETCGDNVYATCVDYEGVLGDNTKITDDCVTIEETTEDLYVITDEIITDLDTSELGQSCLNYPLTEGLIKPTSIFKIHEEKLCDLSTELENLNNLKDLDITDWGIDFGCLVNECQTPTVTLGNALTNISKSICEGVLPPVYETNPRIVSGEVNGNNIVLTRDDDTTVTIDSSTLLDNTNLSRIISGSVIGNDMVFTRDDSTQFGVDIQTLLNTPNSSSIVGGTVSGDNLILTKDDFSNITIDLSEFKDDTNLERIESASLVGSTLTLTRGDSSNITVNLSSLLDDTNLSRVVSGSVSGSTLTLTRNDSSTFNIDVSSLVGGASDGNDFITGGNLSGNTLNLTGTGASGASIDLSSLANTDSQTLSIAGNDLTISNGNTVTLPTGGGGTTQTSGTFTPILNNGITGTVVYAEYVKTGLVVNFTMQITNLTGTINSNFIITGLPFNSVRPTLFNCLFRSNSTPAAMLSVMAGINGGNLFFYKGAVEGQPFPFEEVYDGNVTFSGDNNDLINVTGSYITT